MNFASVKSWIMQPSTILGVGSAAATIAGLVAHAFTHDITVSAAAGGAAFALVHVVLPDNTGAQSSIEKLVTDAVTAAAHQRLAAALPALVQDGMDVLASLTSKPETTTTTTTTTQIPVN